MSASKPLNSLSSIPRNVCQPRHSPIIKQLIYTIENHPKSTISAHIHNRNSDRTRLRHFHSVSICCQRNDTSDAFQRLSAKNIKELNVDHGSRESLSKSNQILADHSNDFQTSQNIGSSHKGGPKKTEKTKSFNKHSSSTRTDHDIPHTSIPSSETNTRYESSEILDEAYLKDLPQSTLSLALDDFSLQENVGDPAIRNLHLEAAVRMLADKLLVYSLIDRTLSYQRYLLEAKSELTDSNQQPDADKTDNWQPNDRPSNSSSNTHSTLSKLLPSVYPGIQQDFPVFSFDSERLSSLSKQELEDLHMYFSKKYVFSEKLGYSSYLNYLNNVLRSPGASPNIFKMPNSNVTKLSRTRKRSKKIEQSDDSFETQSPQSFTQYAKRSTKNEYEFNDMLATESLNNSIRNVLRDFSPLMLPKIARTLMLYPALPNVHTFMLLIKQLNLYHLEVPARLVLESVLLSGQPLNSELYRTFVKLAISTSDKLGLLKLINIFDLNTVTTPDNSPSPINNAFRNRFNPLKMSSYITNEWPSPNEADEGIREKFFGATATSVESYNSQHSILNYIAIISGFVRFHWFFWVDLAIRKMAAEGLPLTIETLTMNMKAAIMTNDSVKALWTWDEIVDLPTNLAQTPEFDKAGNRINRCFYDEEVYKLSLQAAKKFGNDGMLALVESYNEKMMERKLACGHLKMEIPPEYYPLDDRGRPIKPSNGDGSHKLKHQSLKSRITNALSSTFLHPFSFKTERPERALLQHETDGSEAGNKVRDGAEVLHKGNLEPKGYIKQYEKDLQKVQGTFNVLSANDQLSNNILASKFGGMLVWEPKFGVGEEQFLETSIENEDLIAEDEIQQVENAEEIESIDAGEGVSGKQEGSIYIVDGVSKKWYEVF